MFSLIGQRGRMLRAQRQLDRLANMLFRDWLNTLVDGEQSISFDVRYLIVDVLDACYLLTMDNLIYLFGEDEGRKLWEEVRG